MLIEFQSMVGIVVFVSLSANANEVGDDEVDDRDGPPVRWWYG